MYNYFFIVDCIDFCEVCTSSSSCTKCLSNPGIRMINKVCTCATDNGFYIAYDPILERNECKPCYGLCNTCHGPLPTDCDNCNTIKGAISLRPNVRMV